MNQVQTETSRLDVDNPHAKKLCAIGDILGRLEAELRNDEPISGSDAVECLCEIFDVLYPGERSSLAGGNADVDADEKEVDRGNSDYAVTNAEFLDDLMHFSSYGALVQVFVLQALVEYGGLVGAADPDQMAREMGSSARLLSPHAWIGVAREVHGKVTSHLGRRGDGSQQIVGAASH